MSIMKRKKKICGSYHCYFTNEVNEARRSLVSALEEQSYDQSVWLQSVVPNRYVIILIVNEKMIL